MSDQVDELLREIETLRDALQGRTVSCSMCNYTAKQREELIEAVQTFVRLNRIIGRSSDGYGSNLRMWRKAMDNMCRLANVNP